MTNLLLRNISLAGIIIMLSACSQSKTVQEREAANNTSTNVASVVEQNDQTYSKEERLREGAIKISNDGIRTVMDGFCEETRISAQEIPTDAVPVHKFGAFTLFSDNKAVQCDHAGPRDVYCFSPLSSEFYVEANNSVTRYIVVGDSPAEIYMDENGLKCGNT